MARKTKIPKGKSMNSTYFVFCEGKTEAAYVDLLRRNFRIPVEIITKISDSNINQRYIETCKREKFTTDKDKTFLMFDLDVKGMFERLRKIDNTILIVSNPCIEYWFLLHYSDIISEITSAECVMRLKKYSPDYIKGFFSKPMSNLLIHKIEEASIKAKKKIDYANPSSTIYRLIDEIISRNNL